MVLAMSIIIHNKDQKKSKKFMKYSREKSVRMNMTQKKSQLQVKRNLI